MVRKILYQAYLVLCAIAAVAFGIASFMHTGFSFDVRLLIFLILLLQNANYQVKSEQASYSINYPLLFPLIAVFGSGWATFLSSFGLISLDEFKDNSVSIFLYNRGALGLAAGISAWVFELTGGTDQFVIALLGSAATYLAINILLFYISQFIAGESVGNNIKYIHESVKVILPSATLAALFYGAYQWFDVFGVIAVYYLFTAVRSNLLFGHFEVNYRLSLIKALLRAVYAKDQALMQHLENVAYYTKLLASNCDYPRWKLAILDEASYLHDIGKLEISDDILKKTGKLTPEEYREMCTHPVRGQEFLKEILLPGNHKKVLENIVCFHHERYDGKGYPYGLAGENIPLEARIVAIADAWDAMISERCYRSPLGFVKAVEELEEGKGAQFDPHLVDIFIKLVKEQHETKGTIFASPNVGVTP